MPGRGSPSGVFSYARSSTRANTVPAISLMLYAFRIATSPGATLLRRSPPTSTMRRHAGSFGSCRRSCGLANMVVMPWPPMYSTIRAGSRRSSSLKMWTVLPAHNGVSRSTTMATNENGVMERCTSDSARGYVPPPPIVRSMAAASSACSWIIPLGWPVDPEV